MTADGKRYFTGKPCKRGHIAERRMSDGHCVVCSADKFKRWAAANPLRFLAYGRARQKLPEPTRPAPEACECCGRQQTQALSLDHCHETGRFRGWLCAECNLGIGKLGDNLAGILRALYYLITH